mmetsp:Transcript_24592/g.53867  ORF Transcript_24592/g.53867 Transcript_24592/m.53867 type:complete len:256 (-) Transcript_24592:1035-1802(-)
MAFLRAAFFSSTTACRTFSSGSIFSTVFLGASFLGAATDACGRFSSCFGFSTVIFGPVFLAAAIAACASFSSSFAFSTAFLAAATFRAFSFSSSCASSSSFLAFSTAFFAAATFWAFSSAAFLAAATSWAFSCSSLALSSSFKRSMHSSRAPASSWSNVLTFPSFSDSFCFSVSISRFRLKELPAAWSFALLISSSFCVNFVLASMSWESRLMPLASSAFMRLCSVPNSSVRPPVASEVGSIAVVFPCFFFTGFS